VNHTVHNKLVSFIWSIADDCLRDVYVRGKYRDVILPMVVLRRLDALLEPNKTKVMEELAFQQGEMGLTELDESALQAASGYVFYNISKWTLSQLHKTATNNQQILLANFEEYLDGFSGNVKDIIRRFNLKAQVRHMAAKDVLLDVLEKFTSPYINLTPKDIEDPEGNRLPALSNLGMGYVFEELIRKFNEENNEEAGEHFTPREVIELMTHLVFDPIKDRLPTVMTIYDPACGSGGMLTESQNFIEEKYPAQGIQRDIHLYGKEINDETYAICKSDMMIKGNDPAHIRPGSTLSVDEFAGSRFDFMLSNPPYGKSWASEQKFIKEDGEVIDPRFKVRLKDYWGHEEVQDATPRSSDGQLLFLMEMVSKMKAPGETGIGSRIASVHNGSSLFTGDAGGGESNIRRHIIENDLLEAIIQPVRQTGGQGAQATGQGGRHQARRQRAQPAAQCGELVRRKRRQGDPQGGEVRPRAAGGAAAAAGLQRGRAARLRLLPPRQARRIRHLRVQQRPARQREHPAGRLHPPLLQGRGTAPCRGGLDQSGVGEDRLRDQLQQVLLQAPAAAQHGRGGAGDRRTGAAG